MTVTSRGQLVNQVHREMHNFELFHFVVHCSVVSANGEFFSLLDTIIRVVMLVVLARAVA